MTTTYIEIPTLTLEMMMGLTEAELKTLLTIMRHIEGEKTQDVRLTYSQLSDGVYGEDGRMRVRGTGLCHKSIGRAITLLVDKGYLTANMERAKGRWAGIGNWPVETGRAATFSLGRRMRPLREWTTSPNAKPIPEARYGVKTPMAA